LVKKLIDFFPKLKIYPSLFGHWNDPGSPVVGATVDGVVNSWAVTGYDTKAMTRTSITSFVYEVIDLIFHLLTQYS